MIVDARYERVREGGVIMSRAIFVGLGIDWEGRRQVLAVEVCEPGKPGQLAGVFGKAGGERIAWVRLVVSDDHPVEGGDPGSLSRDMVAAVLRAFSEDLAGLPAAQA